MTLDLWQLRYPYPILEGWKVLQNQGIYGRNNWLPLYYIEIKRLIYSLKYGTIFRYIACGLIILGTGSFFFSLPHFLSPKLPESNGVHNNEVANTAERDLCNGNADITNVSESDIHASLSHYRCWFIIGQILHGIGAAPILTLGSPKNHYLWACQSRPR